MLNILAIGKGKSSIFDKLSIDDLIGKCDLVDLNGSICILDAETNEEIINCKSSIDILIES